VAFVMLLHVDQDISEMNVFAVSNIETPCISIQ